MQSINLRRVWINQNVVIQRKIVRMKDYLLTKCTCILLKILLSIPLFFIHFQIDLFCVNAAEDINDVTFHEHPVVPEGVKLGDLVGTPDYDLAAGLIEAALESVTVEDCDATGNYGLASFPWLDSQDQTNPVNI